MLKKLRYFIFALFVLFLSACAEGEIPTEVATPSLAVIEIYSSPTPSPIILTPTPLIQPTDVPLPTATPIVYQVVEGDNLSWIASRYGITLTDLLSANPSIDPSFLFVGAELLIPTEGSEGGVALLPVVAPEQVSSAADVQCYSSPDGGLSCLWLLRNDLEYALENVSAKVSLLNENGQIVNEGTGILPLNVLPVGGTIPVMVYFPSVNSTWSLARGQLLTALPVLDDNERYLDNLFSELVISYSDSALSGEIMGIFGLIDPLQTSSESWILALAYDNEDTIVGLRRWESTTGFEAGEQQSFSIKVYSLGPPISRVEVLIESRP